MAGRAADIQKAAAQTLAGWHQAAGAEHHLVLDHGTVHDDAAHANQDAVAQGAAVQGDLVADGHLVADDQRVAVRVERPGVGDVQHAAVLHAGARADADAVHVAADHRQRPYRAVGPQLYVADDYGALVDEHPFAQLRRHTLIRSNRHDRNLLSCGRPRL